ncbi:MAG TPA: nodulation protein NfeD [bacterium]|nr:nodulation protein NfeD [bacterium]
MRKPLVRLFVLLLFILSGRISFSKENSGYSLKIDGAIGPVTYYQVRNVISLAEKEEANFVILVIDTPGGLLSSTRKIVQEILASRVPVIAYVYPKGAQCASAGVFIALSCHFIAMSPATNIGAAHPVSLMGKQDEKMEAKIVNDTVSFIKSIAAHHNRNTEWAEKAVRESISSTETEALDEKVIDIISTNIEQVIAEIDGKIVKLKDKEVAIHTKGSKIIFHEESFKDRILKVIADPNIAYILLMIGFIGILLEFYNPGFGIPGIAGTVSLVLAFFALHALPINIAGLILIIISLIFFAIEAVTPAFGLFIISGIVTLVLGSFLLFKPMSDSGVSYSLLLWSVLFISLLLSISIWFVLKTKKRKVATGTEGMVGKKGKTLSPLSPKGQVFVRGEYWNASSIDGDIAEGERIEVTGVEGSLLKVKKSEQ